MGRKPIEVERTGMRTPRERVWDAIRQLRGAPFTRLQIQDRTQPLVDWQTMLTYLSALIAAGYIAPKGAAEVGVEQQYTLIKDAFDAPRLDRRGQPVVQGLATLAMWRAMKALKEFDYQDIARSASLGGVQVKPGTAKTYVLHLARAGYFRTVRIAKPGTPARYRLITDTGAHAPAITRRHCVFDRNMGQFTYQQTEQEVCDGLDN